MTTTTQQAASYRRRIDSNSGPPLNRPHGDVPASPNGETEPRPLPLSAGVSSLRKAAIVLVSLEQSSASNLLSHLDRASVEAVTWEIARLDQIDPEEQELVLEEFYEQGLRRHYFSFDDLQRMPGDDIARGYHERDAHTWALAIASASGPIRAKVLASLQTADAQGLRATLQNLGPFRLADAESAQGEIADRFRSLSDQGIITLPEPSGQDELLA